MKRISVVCAVLRQGDRIFVTQRGYGEFKDGWEFPGGKIEEGETPEEALIREIREELRASIAIDGELGRVEYDYPSFHLSMRAFLCHLTSRHVELVEHENARWVDVSELDDVPFLPADRILVSKIRIPLE